MGLSVYLAGQLFDAVADLYQLRPNDMPTPGEIFARFLGWNDPRKRNQ
ncbi:hypothetical protein AB0C19_07965 [Micromonospora sp. NPDC048842]